MKATNNKKRISLLLAAAMLISISSKKINPSPPLLAKKDLAQIHPQNIILGKCI